jgi:hypothetical protein
LVHYVWLFNILPLHYQVRIKMLFWTGDYPALGKASGMTHSGRLGCHWCMEPMTYCFATQRTLCGDCRRALPIGHFFRNDPQFGPRQDAPAWAKRTHARYMVHAQMCEEFDHRRGINWASPPTHHPCHKSGVKSLSPLALLPGFDVIKDVTPDMMHIVKGVIAATLAVLVLR